MTSMKDKNGNPGHGENIPSKHRGLRPPWQPGQSGNPRGRPKGSRDKLKQEMERLLSAGGDEMPRDFLLRVMRDETQEITLRIAAAKAAAPYCHATPSVDMKVHESVEELSEDE